MGFIVRDYEANLGGEVITTPHINMVQTNNWSVYPQMAFELGLPYDPADPVVPAGSVVTATVEYVVPPAVKSSYYGDSDYLVAMDSAAFEGTDMMDALARDNHLAVEASVGAVVRTWPVEIDVESSRVEARFSLSEGLGYTPVTFHGLDRHDGWRLEQRDGISWAQVDQSVGENDYWQATYAPTAGTWSLTFNVHNRGTNEYRLIR